MLVYGKVTSVSPKNRTFKLMYKGRLYNIYLPTKAFKDYGPYFYKGPYVVIKLEKKPRMIKGILCYESRKFVKIVNYGMTRNQVMFDIKNVRREVMDFINKQENKIFIDLEFSLPPSFSSTRYYPEIVQYGIIIENKEGEIVFEDSSLVRPLRRISLNNRTLRFLSRKIEDFDNSCSYIEFYQLLERCIDEYDAKIFAWGKNDLFTLEKSFSLNHISKLDIRDRYINLMNVIKTFSNTKLDLGLFTTYEDLTGKILEKQSHDALEDAYVAREIYGIFKDKINKYFSNWMVYIIKPFL